MLSEIPAVEELFEELLLGPLSPVSSGEMRDFSGSTVGEIEVSTLKTESTRCFLNADFALKHFKAELVHDLSDTKLFFQRSA